jgi:hypothetical protein
MESSVLFSLIPTNDNSTEIIRIRPKLSMDYTFTYSEDEVTWVTDKSYSSAISYISDLLILLPVSKKYEHYSVKLEIPGFPLMEINVRDLDEKVIGSLTCRISDYLVNRWSPFRN